MVQRFHLLPSNSVVLKSAVTNFLFHIKHVVMTDEQASQDF